MFADTQTEKTHCPYCGERIEVVVDTSVPDQSYIEDCQVCCQPISFHVSVSSEGIASVVAVSDQEGY